MSKKLLIRLVPVVAIAAFVAMPAVAQAIPHYYKTAAGPGEYPLGQPEKFIAWGTVTFETVPLVAASTACEYAQGGGFENPSGGGSGVGLIAAATYWNCVNAECPPGIVTIGTQNYEKEMEVYAPPENVPWPTVLEGGPPFRTVISGVVLRFACAAYPLTRFQAGEGGPNGAGHDELFVLPSGGNPPVTCETDATHELKPENVTGVNFGNIQAKLFYNAGSGLLSCAGGAFEVKLKGTAKIMKFETSELVNAR